MKQLNDYKGQYELESDDELWLVIDKDRWTDAMLSHVAKECAQDDYLHVAMSNPCFELWLLLHLVNATLLTQEEQQQWMENRRKSKNADPYLKVRLRQEMGSYHEADYDALMLITRRDGNRTSKSAGQESCRSLATNTRYASVSVSRECNE